MQQSYSIWIVGLQNSTLLESKQQSPHDGTRIKVLGDVWKHVNEFISFFLNISE